MLDPDAADDPTAFVVAFAKPEESDLMAVLPMQDAALVTCWPLAVFALVELDPDEAIVALPLLLLLLMFLLLVEVALLLE